MAIDCENIDIKEKSTGDSVLELQKYLQFLGYYDGELNGICGPITTEAIKKLQKQHNLEEDGVFSKSTCLASGINGEDISSSTLTLDIETWKDITKRHNEYVSSHKEQPSKCYVDINTKYQYITIEKYNDIKSRYDAFVKEHNVEPNFCYINPPKNVDPTDPNETYFANSPHWTATGCNKLGQCNSHNCGPHSLHQVLCKFGVDDYTELQLASVAGTTSSGTSHNGLNVALKWVNSKKGTNYKIEWKNFSDFGDTINERFKKIGQLISKNDTDCIFHNLYRNRWGHYEVVKAIDIENKTVVVLNSLGNKSTSTAFKGYLETRSFNTFASYLAGISQPSIGVVTK